MSIGSFEGESIIIAEDDEFVRHHLVRRMVKMGLVVYEAGTGAEVLRFARLNPELIIMDVKMPEMDGLETTRRLKSDEATRSIPIVLLSAMAQRQQISEGLAAGAEDYVVKPVTFDHLIRIVRKYLRD